MTRSVFVAWMELYEIYINNNWKNTNVHKQMPRKHYIASINKETLMLSVNNKTTWTFIVVKNYLSFFFCKQNKATQHRETFPNTDRRTLRPYEYIISGRNTVLHSLLLLWSRSAHASLASKSTSKQLLCILIQKYIQNKKLPLWQTRKWSHDIFRQTYHIVWHESLRKFVRHWTYNQARCVTP